MARSLAAISLFAALAGLFVSDFASAQRIPKQELKFYTQPYTPTAGARLLRRVFFVEIHAVVRNAQGEAVAGLRRADFQVYDNGRAQTITQFKVEHTAIATRRRNTATATAPAPRSIALFFDDLNTPFGDLSFARKGAEKFIREDLRAGDKVAVSTASQSVTLNFTGDRQKLRRAIASVRLERPGSDLRPIFSEVLSQFTLESLNSVIARAGRMPGDRIVVLISSGFYTTPLRWRIDEIASEALHADVLVDALDVKGLVPFEGNAGTQWMEDTQAERNDVMSDLAMDTGGTFFHNDNDLAAGLRRMTVAPHVSYLLGFSPFRMKDDGRYHNLKVKVMLPGSFKIQARRGYFAPARASRRAETRIDKLDREVLENNRVKGFPVRVDERPGELPSGRTGMQVSLHLDPRVLSFQKYQRRHLDELGLVVALFDGSGKFVKGERGLVDMALKEQTLKGLFRRGLNAHIVLEAPRGTYRLRVVVEDLRSGKIFAATRTASVP